MGGPKERSAKSQAWLLIFTDLIPQSHSLYAQGVDTVIIPDRHKWISYSTQGL